MKDRLLRLRRLDRTFVVMIAFALACAFAALAPTGASHPSSARAAESATASAAPPPTYVGSAVCAGCHESEAKLWKGSHHQLAMDHATDKSVLGDFANATF